MNVAKYDMKIQYQDEYGESLYTADTDVIPSVGHSIIFADEDYRVKSVIWIIEHGYVIVEVTQNAIRTVQKESDNSARLNDMNNAILAVNKRQDASEKKGRAITEKVTSIRKHINTRIKQEKKDTNDSR